MAYKHKTSFFGIPVPGKGDKILSEDEMRKAQIIENQLLAASEGVMAVVYEDGEYNYTVSEGQYTIRVSSFGGKPALLGVINGGLAKTFSTIKWQPVGKGLFYFYVGWSTSLYEDAETFTVFSTTSKMAQSTKQLLLATLDSSNSEKVVLNTFPDGKLYSKDMTSHIVDSTNPHGDLVQDYLTIRKKVDFDLSDDDEVTAAIVVNDSRSGEKPFLQSTGEIIIADKRVSVSLSDEKNPSLKTEAPSIVGGINELFDRVKTAVVSGVFGGTVGVTVEVKDALSILGATVSAVSGNIPAGGVGDISVGYNGQDATVVRADQIIVYNSGGSGGQFRAIVAYK